MPTHKTNSIVYDGRETSSSKFSTFLETRITSYKELRNKVHNLFFEKYLLINGAIVNRKKVLVYLERDLFVKKTFLDRRLLKSAPNADSGASRE